MQNSKIEWCHHTANLWWGCEEVHSGCDNCYAKTLSHRYDGGNPLWGKDSPRKLIKSTFSDLRKYQRAAEEKGEIHRVFVGSMMDIFEKSKPLSNPQDHFTTTDDLRQELFTQITWGDEGLYPNLMFLFLTKRPSNISKMVPAGWLENPPKNVMYGISVSNQGSFQALVPKLIRLRGKKFLSIEPLLGYISLSAYISLIDWVIVGGESGRNARPMHPAWVSSIKNQCDEANVPFFFKQWGEWVPTSEYHDKSIVYHKWLRDKDGKLYDAVNIGPEGSYQAMYKVGKSKSGNLFGGKQHLNFPV